MTRRRISGITKVQNPNNVFERSGLKASTWTESLPLIGRPRR